MGIYLCATSSLGLLLLLEKGLVEKMATIADNAPDKGHKVEEVMKIRIILNSTKVKPLEWACYQLINNSKRKGFWTKGPVYFPTKIMRITTRKTPCGQGTKTWDKYQMRIHKRLIDIHCTSSDLKEVTSF